MKNLIKFLTIVLVATLLFSCEKENLTPDKKIDEGLITLEQLDGRWYFDTYKYDDIEWHCNNVTFNYNGIDNFFADWSFDVENMSATTYGACIYDPNGWTYNTFTKNGNNIRIFNYWFIVESYDNNTLKLKLMSAANNNYEYTEGTITFVK